MDKQDFKIGSLDQLMTLNENAQKLDTSLENVCKKIEKVSFETMKEPTNELQYIPKDRSGPSNPMSYRQYIMNFQWDHLKYSSKKSLNELTISVQKQMVRNDEQIRKNMEELNGYKNKISNLQKKETGNLNQRDFVDDVYAKKSSEGIYIKEGDSEAFQDILVVLNGEKQ